MVMSCYGRFHEIASGQRLGAWASAIRGALTVGEFGYRLGIRLRNAGYDRHSGLVHRVEIPVVSVGNLTTGGTGKTPMTAWIARWFHQHGIKAGIVSRGYGTKSGQPNDEARELEILLPGVPHVQNPDRVAAAREAIDHLGCRALVLDDAFQHRRIDRDLDVVLVDASEPFGYGRLLPRGLLREPLSSLKRADVIGLTRADLVSERERLSIISEIKKHAPASLIVEVAHRPQCLMDVRGVSSDLASIHGTRVAAFCGIGNPIGFRRTLEACGVQLVDFRAYPDHCPFHADQRSNLAAWAEQLDVSEVVCTMKDFVKVRDNWSSLRPLRALVIGIEWLKGLDEFSSRLESLVARRTNERDERA